MIIKEITYQHRRDFSAIMECEFCGHTQKNDAGYDDQYYHTNVVPNIKCKKCDKSTISGGGEINPRTPKYPEGFQI
jgi:hypothetical protein